MSPARPVALVAIGVVVVAIVATVGLVWSGLLPMMRGPQTAVQYPEPRFPSYLKAPKGLDDVMPFARAAVRQTGGRTPLGLLKEGQVGLMVLPHDSEELIVQAIQRAAAERGVDLRTVWTYELKGITREHEVALQKGEHWWGTEDGYMEFESWVDKFGDPEAAKAWLKARRPDLYDAMYPSIPVPNVRARNEGEGLVAYLDQHSEIGAVFWGHGGRTSHRKRLEHHGDKFYGNSTYTDRWTVMSKVPEFPGDVWRLEEEKAIEPIAFADLIRVHDPQGTNFTYELTADVAAQWSKGVYQQGHLYMFPTQAGGRFPNSLIEYPALMKDVYVPPMDSMVTGVIAGTTNHTGFFPRIEVHLKDGRITEVKGGGLYGEIWREFLQFPGINDKTYPYFDRPGYWYVYEAGTGTNPKYFGGLRATTEERNVSGVVHWAFGREVQHGPDGPEVPQVWRDFVKANNLPGSHWLHIHNVLMTYQLRIRGTEQFVTVVDKGRLTSLDSPEVRALASRYGDPDEILKQEWVRHLPGINAPGSFEEYSASPAKFEKQIDEEIERGTYRYFSK